MASNFYIVAKKKRNQFLELRLFGDFDASSACELINYLDESVNTSCKVIIDTDGLRAIDGFGLVSSVHNYQSETNSWRISRWLDGSARFLGKSKISYWVHFNFSHEALIPLRLKGLKEKGVSNEGTNR